MPPTGLILSEQQANTLLGLDMEEAKVGVTPFSLWWRKRIKGCAHDLGGIGHVTPVMTKVLDPCSSPFLLLNLNMFPSFCCNFTFSRIYFLANIKLHASEHVYSLRI